MVKKKISQVSLSSKMFSNYIFKDVIKENPHQYAFLLMGGDTLYFKETPDIN
jgi:hypothetical protein